MTNLTESSYRRRLQSVAALVIGLATLGGSRVAHANLTNLCWLDQSTAPWYSPKADIPVYYNNDTINNPQYNTLTITGLTDYQMAVAIKRATTIWNEYGGGSVKLRYAGPTNLTYKDHAVVLLGDTTPCNPAPDCQMSPNACAPLQTEVVYNEGSYFGSRIWLFQQYQAPGGQCFATAGIWTTGFASPGQVDLVGALVHELGHAVFNIGHPGQSTYPYGPSCQDQGVVSTMNSTIHNRDISHWDREIVQQRYGVRSQYSNLYHNKMLSDTSWKGSVLVSALLQLSPLFRMGSMSANWSWRQLGWGYGGSSVQPGGAGLYEDVGYYSLNSVGNWFHLASSSVGSPAAIATREKPSSPRGAPADAIFTYLKFLSVNGSNIYNDPRAEICYRRSSNNGSTWGAEVCTNGIDLALDRTAAMGITAAYDPYSNSFLIAYIRDDELATHDIVILTVPASGSATPIHFTPLVRSAAHAPSIACTGASNRCLVLYDAPDSSGWLTGAFVGVQPSTGTVVTYATTQWPMDVFDTPGLAYKTDDNTFRMALTDSSSYIYSYRMSNSDPSLTWYGNGDIWNNSLSQVSTAVLSTRQTCLGCSPRTVYGFFLKYW